jgi:hypothetical protein
MITGKSANWFLLKLKKSSIKQQTAWYCKLDSLKFAMAKLHFFLLISLAYRIAFS